MLSDPTPLFVGDHPALDFINTIAMVEGHPVDFLASSKDVLQWLRQSGLVESHTFPKHAPASLLPLAHTLRELIHTLIEHRKASRWTDHWADLAAFNCFLEEAASYPRLIWEHRKQPTLERVSERKTAKQLLAPLAESAADLLVHGDFDLIRKCEDPGCVLWFYDRTKSHRRRWCSMAVCGNRNKVKAFRKRQQA